MKQIWKKMLAACCTAILLLNVAEFTVQADNAQEEIVTSENVVSDTESGLESTPDEGLIDTGEEDEEEAESYISEEQVGNGILEKWTVGDNVTVELLPTESGGYTLNFQFCYGVLWSNWKEILSEYDWGTSYRWERLVESISFTDGIGPLYLPEDSTALFRDFSNIDQLDVSKLNTSKVKKMTEMFSGCENLLYLDLSSFNTSNVTSLTEMFFNCKNLREIDLSSFDTSNVTSLESTFFGCSSLTALDLSNFDTSNVDWMVSLFRGCSSLREINLDNFNTSKVKNIENMFNGCSNLTHLDLSGFNTSELVCVDYMFVSCTNLTELDMSGCDFSKVYSANLPFSHCENLKTFKTPANVPENIDLGKTMYDRYGNSYTSLPLDSESIVLQDSISIENASIAGISLSYGYSGRAYTPEITVKVGGVTLTKDTDYTVKYINNVEPGTATVKITGKGLYTGTKNRTFEIVDCVSSPVSGKTYQLIPKNNSSTAVCAFSGRMVNNTRVYITNRSSSEAMKFKAVKNSDGTWKFINSKCELALAVQQNSTEKGKGLVLYDQTSRKAQNWKLSKKSDNSFAIINSVTGYSIAMSDSSAVKGTTLSMAETASSGLQRFYLAETSAVSAPFDGTKSVRASKDKNFALNIASSSKTDGANVNLYTYSNTNAKKFKIIYSGGGYYRLVNVNSGLCLTVKGNTKTDGANVIQSKWAGQSGQRWKITNNSNGTVTLKNALGTVLHLNSNKTANGTNVVAKNAATTGAQKWYLG